MNIIHLKYAVEVARCGSINKAAEVLLMNQPNLSRAIRELEDSLGTKIFSRSTKGMVVTPEGEIFLQYAGKILSQVDEVESLFKRSNAGKKRFSVSVPRATYISHAFARFSNAVSSQSDAEFIYEETNSQLTIKHILDGEHRLGIVRYAEHYDKFYKSMLDDKDIAYEMLGEFEYCLLMSKDNPLASKEIVTFDDLGGYIEVAHSDPFVPSLSFAQSKKEELPYNSRRRILIGERSSQFDILSQNTATYMWATPIGRELERHYGLTTRRCPENSVRYKDVIIRMKEYRMTELDNAFVAELCRAKREFFAE